jgi:hypothetical protein
LSIEKEKNLNKTWIFPEDIQSALIDTKTPISIKKFFVVYNFYPPALGIPIET